MAMESSLVTEPQLDPVLGRGWVGDGSFPKTLQLPAEGAGELASPGENGWRGWD